MSPKEVPKFYLYSQGIHPDLLTLGTLVFKNYAQPEERCATYRGSILDQHISSQAISGLWRSEKDSEFGLGVHGVSDLGSVTLENVRSSKRAVYAKDGERIILNEPLSFFQDYVISNQDIQRALRIWLTTAKSGYVLKKGTFQKPKIYCVTGIYKLKDARAWVDQGRSVAVGLGVSAAAAGIPLEIDVGPYNQKETLTFTTSMPGWGIWAARFHQLNVKYLLAVANEELKLPRITLVPDPTSPRHGIMGSKTAPAKSVELEGQNVVKSNIAELELDEGIEEVPDRDVPGAQAEAIDSSTEAPQGGASITEDKYWEAFREAERLVAKKVARIVPN